MPKDNKGMFASGALDLCHVFFKNGEVYVMFFLNMGSSMSEGLTTKL